MRAGGLAGDGAWPDEPAAASSPDQIFRDVVRGLYEGRYVPGQRLVESDLTHTYGVSRSTVREALSRLAAERIVSVSRHRGAQIRHLSRSETNDMLALVELLIGLAARLAATAIDAPAAKERLSRALDHLLSFENRQDSFDLLRARNGFYRTLVEIGGNRELARVLPGMHVHLVRVHVRQHVVERPGERFSDYRALGKAVLAGDGRRAELAARRHVRCLAEALARVPDEAFARDGEAPDAPGHDTKADQRARKPDG